MHFIEESDYVRHSRWQSVTQALAIVGVLILVIALAGSGCTDLGSVVGTSGDNDTTSVVDTVFFAADVLPIFQANCNGGACHVPGPEPNTGLSLKDYASVISGSNTRDVVIPGNAQDSELIKRLEGRSQPSMPAGRPLLSEATIQVVRDWIDQGALDN